jgi:hypothetical protein
MSAETPIEAIETAAVSLPALTGLAAARPVWSPGPPKLGNKPAHWALHYAAAGFPVFACNHKKKPLHEGGFHNATRDPAKICQQFADPAAVLVGIPTGAASGIDVLDLDPGSAPWYVANRGHIPATLTFGTRRGGHHLPYRHREGVGCSAGKIAEGVDVRGDGGYFIVWNATGLPIFDTSPIADMGDRLFDTIMAAQGSTRKEAGSVQSPDRLAPKVSAAEIVAMFRSAENRLEVSRDDYVAVMMATQGTVRGGLANGSLTQEAAEEIIDAACDLASRWEGANALSAEEEREKFDRDFATRDRDLSGFVQLVNILDELGADTKVARLAMIASVFHGLDTETDDDAPTMSVDEERENFLSLFSAEAWEELEIADPDRLLDDVITNGSRTFIAGKTGLGKTHLVHAIAAGIASGTGCLHWKSSRPARVLVVDGEMSKRALKPRIGEAIRRLPKGVRVPRDNLIVLDQDRAIAQRGTSPSLPPFAPLNTEAGHKWTLAVLKLVGKVDVIILDNVMSLTVGDQKDEQVWADTIPLVQRLSHMGVAQIWIDHTGHSNTDRMYGSATKAWRFDSVLMLTEPKGKKDPEVTRFDLQFIKARNRAPDNWGPISADVGPT